MQSWSVVLALFVAGLVIGAVARALLPGTERLGRAGTALAAVGGSLTGGFVALLVFGTPGWWSALLFAVAGAVMFVAPFARRSVSR